MKTLVICRHAKSDWSQNLPDIQRPLNARGEKDAPMMGRLLKAYEFQPDLILSSPAVRARTTAEAVASELGLDSSAIRIESGMYHEGPGRVLGLVQDLPNHINTAMIFGHNPTFESVARMLLGSQADLRMPTAGMVCIQSYAASWEQISPRNCSLQWFLIPRLVKSFRKGN